MVATFLLGGCSFILDDKRAEKLLKSDTEGEREPHLGESKQGRFSSTELFDLL